MQTLIVSTEGPIMTIRLNRPGVKNAFDEIMIAELTEAFSTLSDDVRAIILTGNGPVFCAGADVSWMKRSATYAYEENLRDAQAMSRMFRTVDECSCPVIGRVNGTALGGGMGLIACCDIAIAVDTAQFGYTEARLGIIPAVISPLTLAKIGIRAARRYFLTAERFDAAKALSIGLVHEVVGEGELDARVEAVTNEILKNGPVAVAAAKKLIREVAAMDRDTAQALTVETIARLRTSPEGQEGLGAFLEKRKPGWQ